MSNPREFDSQTVALLGRNRLISELLRAGLEVAMPARDRGVDLIAYVDLASRVSSFIAKPIQMKAATGSSFSVDRKYERISDLVLAHVWHLGSAEDAVTYGLLYPDAVAIAKEMGWTATPHWARQRSYTTTRPSRRLQSLLVPHRMTSQKWRDLIVGPSNAPATPAGVPGDPNGT